MATAKPRTVRAARPKVSKGTGVPMTPVEVPADGTMAELVVDDPSLPGAPQIVEATVTHRFVPTDGQFYPGLPDRHLTTDDEVDGDALRRAIAAGIFEVVG